MRQNLIGVLVGGRGVGREMVGNWGSVCTGQSQV